MKFVWTFDGIVHAVGLAIAVVAAVFYALFSAINDKGGKK